ncbi:type II toxin-antitoxin system RelE/ParE family toxin [Methylobacterium sp. CM6247]
MEIRRTNEFDRWLKGLRDVRAKSRIALRLDRLAQGNSGDIKPVGEGVSELRIDYGPGYRIYVVRRGEALVILLCGGDKGDQVRDIARAKMIARTV